MKRIFLFLTLAVLFSLACGNSPSQAGKEELNTNRALNDARQQFYNGKLTGTGTAKADDLGMAKKLAQSRARLDLAQQITSYLDKKYRKTEQGENFQIVIDLILKDTRTKSLTVLEDGSVRAEVILLSSGE